MIINELEKKWVTVHDEFNAEIRRYAVPGGWLYQVRGRRDASAAYDPDAWHPPVFVPEPRAE